MRKLRRYLPGVVLAAAAMFLQFSSLAVAQDDDYDPPSRVARMNYSEGAVSFQPGGEGDWLDADANRPLTTGDNLWTDRDSRDEIHIGSTALRMGSETSLTFLALDDRSTQLRLAQGSLIVRLRHFDGDENFEVDTPNLAFTLLRAGEYRINVDPNGDATIISVWDGRGEVTGGGYTYNVEAGQEARFLGVDQLQYDVDPIGRYGDFENWALDRDRREDRLEAREYLSDEMTGYEDLDQYGQWRNEPEYGYVWYPTAVETGWAPYRNGHWTYIAPWGWTWVDDERWGFAPFHYGRWAYARTGWFWVPGPRAVRPIYAPALVAFVGGSGFQFGGGPAVAWFPLGPGEVFVPGYRVSRRYVENVNVTNTRVNVVEVTNVYNNYSTGNVGRPVVYRNQRVESAVTVVTRDTFVNARPVQRNTVRANVRDLADARVVRDVSITPAKASIEGARPPAHMKPPAAVERRQVVAKVAPPAPARNAGGERPATRNEVQPLRGDQNPSRPQNDNANTDRQRNVPRPPQSNSPEEPGSRESRQARPDVETPAHDNNRDNSPDNNNDAQRRSRERNQQPEPQTRDSRSPEAPAARDAQPVRGQNGNPPARDNNAPQRAEDSRSPQRDTQNRDSGNQQGWSHPLAKPAPPVREKSPAQVQQEQQKVRDMQQKRETTAPKAPEPPKPSTPPKAPEPPKANQPPKPNSN